MNMLEYKPSSYNLITESESHGYIANSLSRSSLKIEQKYFKNIIFILNNLGTITREYQKYGDIIDMLKKNGFIVDNSTNEKDIVLKKYIETNNQKDLAITVPLTMSCNMSCYYCYEAKNEQNIDTELADKILCFINENLIPSTNLHINWYGGEPLLNKEIIYYISKKALEACAKKDCTFSADMTTNAYYLDSDTSRSLKTECHISDIQVTLDGPKILHNRVRIHNDIINNIKSPTYDTIVKNIKSAISNHRIAIRVNISNINKNEIKSLIDDLHAEGISDSVLIYFAPVFTFHVEKNKNYTENKKIQINEGEFARLEIELLNYANSKGFKMMDILSVPFGNCIATKKNGYIIDTNGDIKKCDNDLGCKNSSYTDLDRSFFQKSNLKKWMGYVPTNDSKCSECSLLPICYSGCLHKKFNSSSSDSKCPSLKYNWEDKLKLLV